MTQTRNGLFQLSVCRLDRGPGTLPWLTVHNVSMERRLSRGCPRPCVGSVAKSGPGEGACKTTKTDDALIRSFSPHSRRFRATNLIAARGLDIKELPLDAFDYNVTQPRRVRIMNVQLGALCVGQWRNLAPSRAAGAVAARAQGRCDCRASGNWAPSAVDPFCPVWRRTACEKERQLLHIGGRTLRGLPRPAHF